MVRARVLLPAGEGSAAAGLGDGGEMCHPSSTHASLEATASGVRTNRLPGGAALGCLSGAPRRQREENAARGDARADLRAVQRTVQLAMPYTLVTVRDITAGHWDLWARAEAGNRSALRVSNADGCVAWPNLDATGHWQAGARCPIRTARRARRRGLAGWLPGRPT